MVPRHIFSRSMPACESPPSHQGLIGWSTCLLPAQPVHRVSADSWLTGAGSFSWSLLFPTRSATGSASAAAWSARLRVQGRPSRSRARVQGHPAGRLRHVGRGRCCRGRRGVRAWRCGWAWSGWTSCRRPCAPSWSSCSTRRASLMRCDGVLRLSWHAWSSGIIHTEIVAVAAARATCLGAASSVGRCLQDGMLLPLAAPFFAGAAGCAVRQRGACAAGGGGQAVEPAVERAQLVPRVSGVWVRRCLWAADVSFILLSLDQEMSGGHGMALSSRALPPLLFPGQPTA